MKFFCIIFAVYFLFISFVPHAFAQEFGEMHQLLFQKASEQRSNGVTNGVIYHGNRIKKQVALTFDADMTVGMMQMLRNKTVKSFYDKSLIETLTRTNTKATLFLTGLWIEIYAEEAKALSQNPLFELGSHSYSHKAFTTSCYTLPALSEDEKVMDVGGAQLVFEKYIGRRATLFRFPGGCFTPNDVAILKLAGMTAVQWDVVADDGFNANRDGIYEKVMRSVENGSIIVMHMNGYPNEPVTSYVVEKLIAELTKQGYSFVTVSEILGEAVAN